MLRRWKTDETDGKDDEHPPPRRLLIASTDADTRDTYAGLLRTQGFEALRGPLELTPTNVANTHIGCVVLVGLGSDESTAVAQVDAMRNSDHQQARRTATLLLASSIRSQIFAWETGIDGFLVLPAHLEEIVAAVEEILARPRLERYQFRQDQLAQIRTTDHSEGKFSQ